MVVVVVVVVLVVVVIVVVVVLIVVAAAAVQRRRCVSVGSILGQRPPADEDDTVTCLHRTGLALLNSILIQSVHRRDGRGQFCTLLSLLLLLWSLSSSCHYHYYFSQHSCNE